MSMVEALFTYLISQERIPLHLQAPPPEPAVVPPSHPNPPPYKRSRRNAESSPHEVRFVLNRVRGGATDDELWDSWRFFTREVGHFVWLTRMTDRPDLNGARGFIVSFHADTALIGVKVTAGETWRLPGRNLSWCPPAPDVDDVAAVLAKVIDPEAARRVCLEVACRRCAAPCEIGGRCRVHHPAESRMMLVGQDGPPYCYLCEACGGKTWINEGAFANAPAPGYCWDGPHSTAQLPWLDKRRWDRREDCNPFPSGPFERHIHCDDGMCRTHLTLTTPLLQEEVDDLQMERFFGTKHAKLADVVAYLEIPEGPRDCRIINLMHDGAERVRLDVALSNLEELRITDTSLAGVVVQVDVFPSLEKLVSYCPRTVCTSDSSSLKSLHLYSWRGLEDAIEEMLQGMPSLEELEICRFEGRELAISSRSLRHLGISPAGDSIGLPDLDFSTLPVRSLKLWTPNLMVLDLAHRGRWDERQVVQELTWLDSHPLENNLPDDRIPPPLFVRIVYSSDRWWEQSSNVKDSLRAHPDITYAGASERLVFK